MPTVGGQIEIDSDWTIALVYKCGTTALKAGFRSMYLPPEEPQRAKNAIVVVRHPLKRVVSWWRNQVRDRGRVTNVHRDILKVAEHTTDLDSIVKAIIATPDALRDPHYRSYGAYLAPLTNVHLVALEKLTETWPEGVYYRGPGAKDINKTEDRGEWPSPEVAIAFEEAYHADYLIWEEAIERKHRTD